ncbi:DALR domain-containing protein [Escherichia coli]
MTAGEDISKSLGNFFTVRDVLKYYDAETVRYFLMSGHYRSQLNYSENNLKQARSALERLYTALRGTVHSDVEFARSAQYVERFKEAMDDDFNTPVAYAVLFSLAKEVNNAKQAGDGEEANSAATCLRTLAAVLGLLEQDAEVFLQSGARLTIAKWRKLSRLSNSVWMRVKRKIGLQPTPRVTVSTRWVSCWKMARRAPPGAVSNCAIAGCEFSHPVIVCATTAIPSLLPQAAIPTLALT